MPIIHAILVAINRGEDSINISKVEVALRFPKGLLETQSKLRLLQLVYQLNQSFYQNSAGLAKICCCVPSHYLTRLEVDECALRNV